MNNNNNTLVKYTSSELVSRMSSNIQLGALRVPDEIHSAETVRRSVNHSFDLNNLVQHSRKVAERNNGMDCNDQLYVLRSKKLRDSMDDTWNDQHVLDSMNTIARFKPDIKSYREKITELLQNDNFDSVYFRDMKNYSQSITLDFLKTTNYIEGKEGIATVYNHLTAVLTGKWDPDCLKIYNLLIYAGPFVMNEAVHSGSFATTVFYHSPFELIAVNLQTFMSSSIPENLSFMFRAQLQVENMLYDGSNETLRAIRSYYIYPDWGLFRGTNFRIQGYSLLGTLVAARAAPYLLQIASQTDSSARVPTGHQQELSNDALDSIIPIIIDTLLNL
jgi:hypothetical protein